MKLRTRTAGAFLLLAGISACDVPTGVPRWDTTWITPAEETSVSVAELLPSGLGVNADTSAFILTIAPVSVSWQLSEFCPACPPVAVTAPKPAFVATVGTTASIPAAVQSADVEEGTITIELVNGFDFDPLRPGVAADTGSLTITVRSGSETVAGLVVDGGTQAFAPGDTLELALEFMPSTISDVLEFDLTLDSPAGDNATMSPTDELSARIFSNGILVSEAVVQLSGQAIEGEETELDLEDVDIGDRIKEGTIFFDIQNPFGVTGDLTLTVDPAVGATIIESIELEAGNTTVQVDFTEEEIQRLIGTTSVMTITGSVDGGSVTIRPDMVLGVATRLRVVVEVGGDADENGDED